MAEFEEEVHGLYFGGGYIQQSHCQWNCSLDVDVTELENVVQQSMSHLIADVLTSSHQSNTKHSYLLPR